MRFSEEEEEEHSRSSHPPKFEDEDDAAKEMKTCFSFEFQSFCFLCRERRGILLLLLVGNDWRSNEGVEMVEKGKRAAEEEETRTKGGWVSIRRMDEI